MTTRRIAKKWARKWVDECMGPMAVADTLACAKPSFYTLTGREQREALAQHMTGLGYSFARCKRFARRHFQPSEGQPR